MYRYVKSFGWRALAVVLLLASAAAAARAADAAAAVTAVASGDTAAAVDELARLESDDPARFRANNYDYLLGRLLEVRGDLAGAAARYNAVLERNSNLAEYALWRLAGLARFEGNFPLERQYLDRLVARYPGSLLYARAVDRVGRSAFESGDFRTVVGRFQPVAGTSGAAAREALARVGVAKLRLGDRAAARQDFARLIDGSQDDYALEAARGLDELDAAEKVAVTEFDHVRRGRIYMFNRDWLGARPHFAAVADMAGAQNRAEALYSLGLTYYRTEEIDAAVDWWEKAAREFPSDPTGVKAYLWVGHALQRGGRYEQAVSRYTDFISRYPTDQQVESAYRNAIDSWRFAGNAQQALAWCDRAEAAQPRSPLATFAAFNRAKVRLAAGDASAALAELSRIRQSYNLGANGPGMPSAGEIDLLRGVCLEQLGRVAEAVALYLGTPEGRDKYFGNRATLRLIALGKRPEGRQEVGRQLAAAIAAARAARTSGNSAAAKAAADLALRLTDDQSVRAEMLDVLRAAYAGIPAYAAVAGQPLVPAARAPIPSGQSGVADRSHASLGAELAFLGLYDEAAPELASGGFGGRSSYSLAVYGARGSRGDTAVQTGESLSQRVPADYRVELMPRSVAELIYPAPYRNELRRFALPSGLDPRFELSIMRQESRFKPWVKSPAAARGLMQFIPETSNKIATALGIQRFDQDDLYEPDVAVRIGGRYLSDLFAMFPENPYAVAASYNGGEDAVARWLKRAAAQDDPELFVAEISYKETKDYVYKVMNNYWAYQALYTKELGAQ